MTFPHSQQVYAIAVWSKYSCERSEFMMDLPHARHKWARLLAYVTGLVNQKLLLQNEYLAAENRILRAHLPARMRLSDPERSTLLKSASG